MEIEILHIIVYSLILIYIIEIIRLLARKYKVVLLLRFERFLGNMIETIFKNKL